MTGRILRFAKSPHQSTQELLPWYLNGTLDGHETLQVEEHLRGCADCRSELASVRLLQSAYIDSELPPDAEAALARLRSQLSDAAPTARPRQSRRRPAAPAGLVPVWLRFALGAQFALIFALGWQVLQPESIGLEYHTLASASTPPHAAGSLVVVFDPATPQRDVARILRLAGGRVVDGPTASNGFVMSVAQADLATALARLRAEPQVMLAETLQAEKAR